MCRCTSVCPRANLAAWVPLGGEQVTDAREDRGVLKGVAVICREGHGDRASVDD
jgi:hypothetical protein